MFDGIKRYLERAISEGAEVPNWAAALGAIIAFAVFYKSDRIFNYDTAWRLPRTEDIYTAEGILQPLGILKKDRPIRLKLNDGSYLDLACWPNSETVGCYKIDRDKYSGKRMTISYFYEYNHKAPSRSKIIVDARSDTAIIISRSDGLTRLKQMREDDIAGAKLSFLGPLLGSILGGWLLGPVAIGKTLKAFRRFKSSI